MRFPPTVHGQGDKGFISTLIAIAWMVRLALEQATAGLVSHGVGEEGVAARDIAEHFGWIGAIFALDIPSSSRLAQERLGWTPNHPALLEDLEGDHYYFRTGR